jgi:hypothetical protein
MTRDWSKLFKQGFIQDSGCQVEVTPDDALTFTTIREMDGFDQEDKQVSRIGEASHTLTRYQKEYSKTSQGPFETPTIEIETRQGQFEYAFLFCDFVRTSTNNVMPSTQPVIKSIRYKVFGRENQFTRELDRFDLERISRENCNSMADWRDFHESGQGILIHLADLALTEEAPFPRSGRMKLEFTLLGTAQPNVETFGHNDTESAIAGNKRRFTVCLLRHNRLLKGDIRSLRFTYLNEE